MNRFGRIRLRLLLLAQSYKRGARDLRRRGFDKGAQVLRETAMAYHHAARIVKTLP